MSLIVHPYQAIIFTSYSLHHTYTTPKPLRIENIMENPLKSSNAVYKRTSGAPLPFEPIDNLSKKRPSSTKLDLEKMYEQSLELAGYYKQLVHENQQLKQQFQRVEAVKLNRQNLISTVEKIVEEKSKELNGKHTTNFSWLVFKLNNKIYQLKAKIQAKQRAILDLTLSRESESIRQKQTEIECLNQIVEYARGEGLVRQREGQREGQTLSEIKEIVWMEQEIKQKQSQIIEAQKLYQQEEKEVRRLMQQLAQRKAELKSIKQMESQYHKAQELYREEKRKKQQRIAGNKTYLQQLQNQKAEQLKKLQTLKARYTTMEQQESAQIADLQLELQRLKKDYQERVKTKQDTVIKFSEERAPVNRKKEVKLIGSNLNYTLALRGVNESQVGSYFASEAKEELSIRQVFDRLRRFPFSMERQEEALLVARYVVQDTGDGYFLEDMDTTQSISIIRSILAKLIGQVKVYEKHRAEQLRQHVGPVLHKFGRLVQQLLDLKEGNIRQTGSCRNQLVSKERMVEALENTLSTLQNQNFLHQEVQFTIFYLFSWSRNLNELEVNRLFSMVDEDIQWPSV